MAKVFLTSLAGVLALGVLTAALPLSLDSPTQITQDEQAKLDYWKSKNTLAHPDSKDTEESMVPSHLTYVGRTSDDCKGSKRSGDSTSTRMIGKGTPESGDDSKDGSDMNPANLQKRKSDQAKAQTEDAAIAETQVPHDNDDELLPSNSTSLDVMTLLSEHASLIGKSALTSFENGNTEMPIKYPPMEKVNAEFGKTEIPDPALNEQKRKEMESQMTRKTIQRPGSYDFECQTRHAFTHKEFSPDEIAALHLSVCKEKKVTMATQWNSAHAQDSKHALMFISDVANSISHPSSSMANLAVRMMVLSPFEHCNLETAACVVWNRVANEGMERIEGVRFWDLVSQLDSIQTGGTLGYFDENHKEVQLRSPVVQQQAIKQITDWLQAHTRRAVAQSTTTPEENKTAEVTF